MTPAASAAAQAGKEEKLQISSRRPALLKRKNRRVMRTALAAARRLRTSL